MIVRDQREDTLEDALAAQRSHKLAQNAAKTLARAEDEVLCPQCKAFPGACLEHAIEGGVPGAERYPANYAQIVDPHYVAPKTTLTYTAPTGWICPQCRASIAPHVSMCPVCAPASQKQPGWKDVEESIRQHAGLKPRGGFGTR